MKLETLERRYVLDSTVVFNELMYHELETSTTGEWIELHNQMSVNVDLSDWSLSDGVQYRFPAGTIIPGGGYLVIAASPDDWTGSGVEVLGPWSGNLANGGERVELLDNNHRGMDVLEYGDDEPWPVAPDGGGATLAKRGRLLATGDQANWTASLQVGGTPGASNFPTGEERLVSEVLVTAASSVSLHVPANDSLGTEWTDPDFVEGGDGETWTPVTASIGFDNGQEPITSEDYTDAVLIDQPIGYWPLDDAGPQVADVSGAGRHGSADAGVTFGQPGLPATQDDGRAIVTQGTQRVTIPAFPKHPAGSTGFTVEYWITLLSAPTGFHNIVGDGEASGDFYLMNYLTGAGRIRPHYSFANSPVSTDSNEVLQVGRTYHVATTWDRGSGQASIYIDGELDKTVTVSTNAPSNTDNVLYFGKDDREPGGHFVLDEVAVYDYALSAERVEAHALAGGAGTGGQDLSYDSVIGTDVESDVLGVSSSVYMRAEFDYDESLAVEQLQLAVRYDDGFVAYLNGVEFARENAPESPGFDSVANQLRPKHTALAVETFEVTELADQLRPGTNVLAIHSLNVSADNGDLLLIPELTVSGIPVEPDLPRVLFNEIAAADSPTFWLELINDGDDTVTLQDMRLAGRGEVDADHALADVDLLPGETYVIDQDQLGFRPVAGDRLFLYSADDRHLLDGRAVDDRLRGRSDRPYAGWLFPTTATPGEVNHFDFQDDVVIHEIMYHPRVGQEEWIELFNSGAQEVDLSGWRLRDAVEFTFPEGTTLGAGEYLIVTDAVDWFTTTYPGVAVTGPYDGNLNNAGERIELSDGFGNPADVVEYFDGGSWPSAADGYGASLELVNPTIENAAPEAWQASREGDRSEWHEVSYRGPAPAGISHPSQYNEFLFGLLDGGEILIDDLSVIEDPDGSARSLLQNGTFENDALNGAPLHWRIIGNQHGEVIDDPTDPGNNRVLRVTATGPTEHRHNNAGTTLKFGNSFVAINPNLEYEISFRAKWLSGAHKIHTRLYFNRVARATELPVPDLNGTPGRANSIAQQFIGPTYSDLRHEPLSPRAGEQVTVSVRVADPQGVFAATLWYSVDDGPFQSIAMSIEDGVARGVMPGQASGRTARFFVEAPDGFGIPSTYPAAGRNSSALVRFGDPPASDDLQTIQIIMNPSEQAELNRWTNVMSNDRIGATVVYDGRAYYDVGVRLKGSQRGRTDANRKGYNVSFPPDDLFRGVHPTIGLDRSGGWRFGQTFGQDEIAIHQFFNRAGGIPSMYNDLVYLDAPGSPRGTALLQMARFDDLYLDSQYENGSDGFLYNYELVYFPTTTEGGVEGLKNPIPDGVIGLSPMRDLGTDKETYRWHFENRNRRLDDNFDAAIRLNQTFGLTGVGFQRAADDILDVDQWLRTYAAVSLAGVSDSYFNNSNAHNVRFYERPEDGKILIFAWDMDFAFINSATSPLVNNSDLARLVATPRNYRVFLGHLHDIVETSFNADYMEDWTSHFGDLLPGQDFDAILDWIGTRSNYVRASIDNAVSPRDFEILTPDSTVGGTTSPLLGRAWVDVREIRLQGSDVPLDVRWSGLDQWQVNVSVPFGETTFTLEAYDYQGDLVGVDTVTLTGTATDPRVGEFLRMTEVMYNPPPATAAEIAAGFDDNEDFEFIELTNTGDETIDLTGVRLATAVQYTLGNIQLAAGERIVVVENVDAFRARYGTEIPAVGPWDGRLNNSGESIVLLDAVNTVIEQFEYDFEGDWPTRADGGGSSLEAIDPLGDVTDGGNWRASAEYGGSPGSAGVGPIGDVVINEVLSHTDPPVVDSIELFNATDADIDIGGWYLSDDADDYLKFRIPDGTILPAGGYVVFDESEFNPTPETPGPDHFALDGAGGDDTWLLEADPDGRPVRFVDHVEFSAQANGESWGRWPDASGLLYPMTTTTLGAANSGPRVGPLVLSEIHYNPVDPDDEGPIVANDLEFVEIHNPTDQAVELTNWALGGGIDYDFSADLVIPARGVLVVLSFDPEAPQNTDRLDWFLETFQVDDGAALVGGFSGRIENAGETIRLLRPDEPPLDEPTLVPLLLEDEVRYSATPPWPVEADGGGGSLHRVAFDAWGNDAAGWNAAPPTPGSVVDAPPRVVSVLVNAEQVDPPDLSGAVQPTSWANQRSLLRSVTIVFTRPVLLTADDVRWTNLGVNAPIDEDVPVALTDEQIDVAGNRVVIRFDQPPGDGAMRLELLPSIVDTEGNALDGDGDGVGGDGLLVTGNAQNRLYQLTAEFNGDAGISIFDFNTFAYWFGRSVGVAPAYVDLSDDLGISIFDFTIFADNFGRAVAFPPPPATLGVLWDRSDPESTRPDATSADEHVSESGAPRVGNEDRNVPNVKERRTTVSDSSNGRQREELTLELERAVDALTEAIVGDRHESVRV